MVELKLDSAEGVTRYLRSRDISATDLVRVSNSLLDDKLQVYLPNRNVFILELITERLGDSKFARLRTDYRVWQLLNKAYVLLQPDPKLRNRTFQNFKAGDAIVGALKPENSIDVKLFLAILETVQHIRVSFTVGNLYDQSIPILSHLLQTLISLDELPIDENINNIISFFNTVVTVGKFTTKFTNNFISNALPVLLQSIEFSTKQASKQTLTDLIKRILLSKENDDSMIESTKLLLPSKVTSSSIVIYFKLILSSLPRLETNKIEELYTLITDKFPETAEPLLEFVSGNNRVLSSTFLQEIFKAEMDKDDINFNLIRYVLTLDVDVGLRFAEKLMSYLEDENEVYLPIVREIINTFNKSRYLFNFFQLWFKILEDGDSSTYRSEEFQNLVASYIHNLSSSQLIKLVESLSGQKSNNKYIILSSIVQGMFSLKDKNIITESKELFKPIFDVKESDAGLWKLKYQILSLYEDILPAEELTSIASDNNFKNAPVYQYYTIFRVREIVTFDTTKVISKFVKFLKESSKNGNTVIEFVFKRWFVLANELFSTDEIECLVETLLASRNEKLLQEIFKNDEFFEQSNVTDVLIKLTSKNLESDESKFYSNLLSFIPIQCYPKKLKSSIIESLTELLLTSDRDHILDTLVKILDKTPSFKAKIETDISYLQKVIFANPSNIDLFQTIWNNHIKNFKEPVSSTYVSSSIKHVTSSLDNNKRLSKFSCDFHIALVMLTHKITNKDEISELRTVFTGSIRTVLDGLVSDLNRSDESLVAVSWLLSAINTLDLSECEFGELHESLKNIGRIIQNSEDTRFSAIKVNLFILLSKYSKESSNTEYFQSLYIVLRRSGLLHVELKSGLVELFKTLPIEKFNESFKVCLASLIDLSDANFIVEIVCCYWTRLIRTNEQSTSLFVKSLSLISLIMEELSNETILLVIKDLKSLLVDRSWLISQYGLESIIAFLSKTVNFRLSNNAKFSQNDEHIEELYVSVTVTMSNILLFQRFRLSNRHHLLVSIFNSLLQALSNNSRSKNSNNLNTSKSSAQALARLLSNLCEPSLLSRNTDTSAEKLNTSASILKRGLRKHIHVILLSYIHLALKYSLNAEIRESLLPGIFNIFDVLSQTELNLVNTSLNHTGRTYYRTLYDEYKKVGKWQVD